jgi:hypothetical protein
MSKLQVVPQGLAFLAGQANVGVRRRVSAVQNILCRAPCISQKSLSGSLSLLSLLG